MLGIRRRNLRWVDINMAQLKLDKLIIHFAQTNRAEGKSGKTISWYSEMLKDFTRYLELKTNKGLLSELVLRQ